MSLHPSVNTFCFISSFITRQICLISSRNTMFIISNHNLIFWNFTGWYQTPICRNAVSDFSSFGHVTLNVRSNCLWHFQCIFFVITSNKVVASGSTRPIRIKFCMRHQVKDCLSDCAPHLDPPHLKRLGGNRTPNLFSKIFLSETTGPNLLKNNMGTCWARLVVE